MLFAGCEERYNHSKRYTPLHAYNYVSETTSITMFNYKETRSLPWASGPTRRNGIIIMAQEWLRWKINICNENFVDYVLVSEYLWVTCFFLPYCFSWIWSYVGSIKCELCKNIILGVIFSWLQRLYIADIQQWDK